VNFEAVLAALIRELDRIHTVKRLTMDLDFLVHRDDLNKFHDMKF